MSVDLERIRRRALRRPDMGAFLAELDIPDFVEREQVGGPGHFDIYVTPLDLLGYVVDTQPVDNDP